jgi:RNA ligase
MKTKRMDALALENLITQGYVMKNKHPEHDIWIYNYTQSAQYEQVWNETTLQCRGIILDAEYTVVARPFSKFFNIEELSSNELPNLPFEVNEKMDGSLGVLYWIEDKPFISTRNSFFSEQAIKANEMLNGLYRDNIKFLNTSKTYIFEIIYPDNRVVVNYEKNECLTLLGIIDTNSGIEENLTDIGFPLPNKYESFRSFSELKALNWENSEGFVIKYSNGFRVKIKFENYIELHKVVTQISSRHIWEQLKEGKGLSEWLVNVPDEFYDWVRQTEHKLLNDFEAIESAASSDYRELDTVKETALLFQKSKYSAILFAIYNKKEFAPIIWKMIKPKFEKAYSNKTKK